MNLQHIPQIKHTDSGNFFLLAGPCVVENREVVMETAGTLKEICQALNIPLVFKASYTKANRSSVNSFTGIGHEKALELLAEVGAHFNIPLVTDIHSEADAAMAANYMDVLQIPAFLCRQTSLLVAAAQTGKVVNIKKGQFLSPEAMEFAMQKVVSQGNEQVMLTERGTTFGYHDLIVDYRGIPIMKSFGKPVVMDCTHALQQPNQASGVTGGKPELIDTIARCAIAAGADGLFIETHPDPSKALSDGANMLPLHQMKPLLEMLIRIRAAVI
ncbi:MAG TPA: 3-deoxy-8-phosphooctulonate synthase [Chitinophagaceae bacterium]|nr:3-deoxy-8-phosphooctulonate synthase [Chitinophagaceae bacterium]